MINYQLCRFACYDITCLLKTKCKIQEEIMGKKSDKAMKVFMDILKWITVIPGLIQFIMTKIKEK